MGRYDFRPSRIHQATSRLLATHRIHAKPAWYDVVGVNPPSQILVRTQPVQHSPVKSRKKKPSKLFRPQSITYEEDALRKVFFSDHPWELARPRVILEEDGKDYQRQDWSSVAASGMPPSGESVVQRQLYLMKQLKISKDKAYDEARNEFYNHRLQEDVERRVAKEEALATGAYFGKSYIQVGAELEDKSYEVWRAWAEKEFTEMEQKRGGGAPGVDKSSQDLVLDDPEMNAGFEAVGGGSVVEAGKVAKGSAPASS